MRVAGVSQFDTNATSERASARVQYIIMTKIFIFMRSLIVLFSFALLFMAPSPTLLPMFKAGTKITYKENVGNRLVNKTFTVVRLLGRGGFGEVYEVDTGELTETGERVRLAVKFFRPEDMKLPAIQLAVKTLDLLLIRPEIRAAKYLLLSEPPQTGTVGWLQKKEITFVRSSIVNPLKLTNSPDEFIRFESLTPEAQTNRIKLVARLAREGVSALAELADLGIAHRDIKPQNMGITVSIDDYLAGKGKLVFFDLDLVYDLKLARTQKLFGTPGFIPPDGLTQKISTMALGDAFALGASLFEMLTGETLMNNFLKHRPDLRIHSPAVIQISPGVGQDFYNYAVDRLQGLRNLVKESAVVDIATYRALQQVTAIINDFTNPNSIEQLRAIVESSTPEIAEYGKKVGALPSLNRDFVCSRSAANILRVRHSLQPGEALAVGGN